MKPQVDPDLEKILPLLPLRDAATLTPERARAELVALAELRKDVPLPELASVKDITVDGAAGPSPRGSMRPAKRRRRRSSISMAAAGSRATSSRTTPGAHPGARRWRPSSSASTTAGRPRRRFPARSRIAWPRPDGRRRTWPSSAAIRRGSPWPATAPAATSPPPSRRPAGTAARGSRRSSWSIRPPICWAVTAWRRRTPGTRRARRTPRAIS